MPLANRFLHALLVSYLSIDYVTATYMIHSSCDNHPLLSQAIEAAQILATEANLRLSTRPWNINDKTQREFSQYAKWLFGEDGTAAQQYEPPPAPPIPKGPQIADQRSNLDKVRDSFGNIAILLSRSTPFPSDPVVVLPAENTRPAITSFFPRIPQNTQIFYCDLARLGPAVTPDPTRPRQGYQLDSDFMHQVPFARDGNIVCAPGTQALNYCTIRFCVTQICPEYLRTIENRHIALLGQFSYEVPAIDGPLLPDVIMDSEAEVDFYAAFGGVILHEMTHTRLGGSTGDLIGYGWFDIRSAGIWGIQNADNYLFWAITAKLAEFNNLYTHWNGKVDQAPNEGPI